VVARRPGYERDIATDEPAQEESWKPAKVPILQSNGQASGII